MEGSELNDNHLIMAQVSQKGSDWHGMSMKYMNLSVCVENCHREKAIEFLMNLRHPSISGIIGIVLPSELNVLTIVGREFDDNSLPRIVSTSPAWWTSTAKSRAIIGLVLGLCFAHSFGFFHGHLAGNKICPGESGGITAARQTRRPFSTFRMNNRK
jgi:hypothetical protein